MFTAMPHRMLSPASVASRAESNRNRVCLRSQRNSGLVGANGGGSGADQGRLSSATSSLRQRSTCRAAAM